MTKKRLGKKETEKRLKVTNDLYDKILDIEEEIDRLQKEKQIIERKREKLYNQYIIDDGGYILPK